MTFRAKLRLVTIVAFLALVLAIALSGRHQAGVVTGRVLLEGTPPPEKRIVFDAATARLHGTNPVTTRHWVVGPDGGLGNVLVYIKQGPAHYEPLPAPPADLVITGALYEPYLLAVQTNQSIRLRNEDNLLHTAHISPPRGSKNPERSYGLPGGRVLAAATPTLLSLKDRLWLLLRLKNPAPARMDLHFTSSDLFVRFKCDVHPWEYGYLAVLEHPFFAVTKADGSFTLPPLPPGQYVLEAIHLKAGTNRQELVVRNNETNHLSIILRVPVDTNRVN